MHDQASYYLRKFKPDDLADVKALIYRTIDKLFVPVYSQPAIDYQKQLHTPQQILRDVVNGHTVIIEDKKKIIATGTLLGSMIKRIFVDPDHQKQGLGHRIMDYLEKHALQNGRSVLYLHATTVAKDFYLHLEYQVDKETYIPFDDNSRLDYFDMSKSILDANKNTISYHKKMFRPLPGQGPGFQEDTVLYHFQQTSNRVWVSFKGGMISYGQLLGLSNNKGSLIANFQFLTRDEKLNSGQCELTPEKLDDSRLKLYIKWQLNTADEESGLLIMEELDLSSNGKFFED